MAAAGNAADEHRLQLEFVVVWIGIAGRLSSLPGNGDRNCDQLVYPAPLSARSWNDPGANVPDDSSLGDVASNWIDGSRRSDFTSNQMALDRKNFFRSANQQVGRSRFSNAVGLHRLDRDDGRDLFRSVLQHAGQIAILKKALEGIAS